MLKLLLVFTIVPTVELWLLFKVGDRIGGAETLLLVIGTGILGARMAQREGLSVIHQIQEDAVNGTTPATTLVEGVMILIGGVLLITPGVLTDVVGFSFIVPWTRRALAGPVQRFFASRVHFQGVQIGNPRPGPSARQTADAFSHPTPDSSSEESPFDHPVR